ncbi:MAG: sulfur carrier protein ThiS [Miltoncostaeaceae bacterium]
MRVTINGEPHVLGPGASLADAVARLDVDRRERGVAVAVEAEVVPREAWASTPLAAGMRIEVLRAAAGG